MNLSKRDYVLWAGMIFVTMALCYGLYAGHFPMPIQSLMWIGWLVAVLTLGFFTAVGQDVFAFMQEAKTELQKVVWPSRQETIQTTSIVMLMVVVTGFFLWALDATMMWVIGKITHLG